MVFSTQAFYAFVKWKLLFVFECSFMLNILLFTSILLLRFDKKNQRQREQTVMGIKL